MAVEVLPDGTRIEALETESRPRIKKIILSGDFLLHKIFNGLPRPYSAMDQLPNDAAIINAWFDLHSDRLELIIASASFEEWDGRSPIPEHRLVLTGNYAQIRYGGSL